jgi:hypothetical protein
LYRQFAKQKDITSRKNSAKMALGTLPSILPSKSLDSKLEEYAKDDKYHNIHFKKSTDKRVQVKFDNKNCSEDERNKPRSQSHDMLILLPIPGRKLECSCKGLVKYINNRIQ